MQEVSIYKVRIKIKAGKTFVAMLALLLFLSPILSIANYLCDRQNEYVLAEDFDEKEERNEKKELEELEKIFLISGILKKSFIRTIFGANEASMLACVALCLEVLTPPPQFCFPFRSA